MGLGDMYKFHHFWDIWALLVLLKSTVSSFVISRYSAAGIPGKKPKTIKFIKFYTLPPHILEPNEATTLSLQCMAKMIHHGFNFQPWDWIEFGNNLANEKCKDTLGKALNEKETEERMKEARGKAIEAIQGAEALAQTTSENELCTLQQLQPLIVKEKCKLWEKP